MSNLIDRGFIKRHENEVHVSVSTPCFEQLSVPPAYDR